MEAQHSIPSSESAYPATECSQVRANPVGFSTLFNSPQVKNSTAKENFNLLVLHTIVWRRRWRRKRKKNVDASDKQSKVRALSTTIQGKHKQPKFKEERKKSWNRTAKHHCFS
jgi:hypothetical protein